LSQDEVARAIKAKVLYVAAIENDQFHKLIAPIYAKGFIKLYAKFVGLDPTPFMRQFSGMEVFTEDVVRKRKEAPPAPATKEAPKRRTRPRFAGLTDSIRKIKLPSLNLPKAPTLKAPEVPLKVWAFLAAVVLCLAALPFIWRAVSTPPQETKLRLPPECRLLADPPEPYLDITMDRKP